MSRLEVVLRDRKLWVTFPCFFLGDPDASARISLVATLPRKLLGLSGVVDKVRILFDGTPTPSAIYGNLILETL
jgi:hypothetical protein